MRGYSGHWLDGDVRGSEGSAQMDPNWLTKLLKEPCSNYSHKE